MANWKEIYDRAEDNLLRLLEERAQRRKAAQAQQSQQISSQDTTGAAQDAHVQWYEILVQDKFVDFFKPHNMEVFRAINGKDIFHPVFEEFRGIVLGMTTACSVGDRKRKEISESLARSNPHEALGYNHFLDTCPGGQRRFAEVWQSIQDPYETDAESLSAEQVAVLILYPFWSRMGGSFEVKFAQDGRLGRYLRVLKKQIMDRSESGTSIKYMSYLEAHKIFHDYIEAVVCSGQRENVPFYRKSAFKNSKEEIMYAYKVFMAVAYRYGNGIYSKREVEIYNMMVSSLWMPWVDDEFADGYVECERILNDNSLWGKFKNRTARPHVKEKLDRLNEELFINNREINPTGAMKERVAFAEEILKLVNESVQRAKALPEDIQERKRKLREILEDYCWGAYELIGLSVRQEDINCFHPLPTLYELSTHPSTEMYFTEEQKKYIAQNKNG